MPGLLRKIVAFLIASLVASWLLPWRAFAHGEPAQLAFWGNFSPAIAECQRHIGHAAAVCIARVVRARSECRLATEIGGTCDEEALDREVQTARSLARSIVRDHCTEQTVQNLRYLDINEALTDVIRVCRENDTAAESAIFDAAKTESVTLPPAQTAACLSAMRGAVSKLIASSMRERRFALDRIAATNVPFREKQGLIDHSGRRIDRGVSAAARAIERTCPADVVQALYGRGAATHLANVATRADCFAGAVYVQDGVVCPDPVCGNAIEEPGENCDDGNVMTGDGCDASCRFETSEG